MIIGLVGFIGSGKNTVADFLTSVHGFRSVSFAGAVKDTLAAVFGWPRDSLEGKTARSRQWREQVDTWWAQRLNMPHLTPRWVMQHWATELLRDQFHPDIWIASLEARLHKNNERVVVTDCRFPNEINAVRSMGGQIVWVRRGPLPAWYDEAVLNCRGLSDSMHCRLDVHASEWQWICTEFDHVIYNDGSVEALHQQMNQWLNACAQGLRQPTVDPASEYQPHSSNTPS